MCSTASCFTFTTYQKLLLECSRERLAYSGVVCVLLVEKFQNRLVITFSSGALQTDLRRLEVEKSPKACIMISRHSSELSKSLARMHVIGNVSVQWYRVLGLWILVPVFRFCMIAVGYRCLVTVANTFFNFLHKNR